MNSSRRYKVFKASLAVVDTPDGWIAFLKKFPKDAVIIGFDRDYQHGLFVVLIESSEFDEVPQGVICPELQIFITREDVVEAAIFRSGTSIENPYMLQGHSPDQAIGKLTEFPTNDTNVPDGIPIKFKHIASGRWPSVTPNIQSLPKKQELTVRECNCGMTDRLLGVPVHNKRCVIYDR